MRRSKSEYVIQTVANAMRLLEVFHDEEELGVTDLSRRLELHKNNVFRLLATLEETGYVEQASETDRYRLAARCLELGHAYSRTRSLARLARPVLEALTRSTNETSHLAVLSDWEVVHLDGEQPEGELVQANLRNGRRLPAHCTALGKAMLASGDPEGWERFDRDVVQVEGLAGRTGDTITDRDKFFEHLRGVATQGFAVDMEECSSGLRCASAPIHDALGTVVGALSISAPAFRLGEDQLHDQIVPQVIDAAGELSRRLGHG